MKNNENIKTQYSEYHKYQNYQTEIAKSQK